MASPTTSPARPTRQRPRHLFGLEPRTFPSNQSSQALSVIWGRHFLSGFYLTPIFNDRAEAIKERVKTGKKSSTLITGYNYFGTYALAICFNHITEIEQIHYVENTLLEAVETPVGANTPLTVDTAVGDFVFYPGGATQPIPAELASLGTQPGYRGMAYVICNNVTFGNSPSPPQLQFTVKRELNLLDLTAHQVDGDAVLAEVIYDLLTNLEYGLRIDPTRIDQTTFENIGNAMITESHGLSPVMDEDTSARQLIGDLLEYADLAITEAPDHRLQLVRIRDLIPRQIDSNDLLEPLVKEPESWAETHTETRVEYNERDTPGDTRSLVYHDMAASANGAQNSLKEYRRPFITRAAIASGHAIELGRFGGVPEVTFNGHLNSNHTTLNPGEIIVLNGDKIVVQSIEIAGPGSAGVEFSGVLDRSYLRRLLPGVTEFSFSVTKLQPANAIFRISQVLAGDLGGKADGFLLAAARPNAAVNAGVVHIAHNLQYGWHELAQINLYGLAAKINAWRHINGRNDALDVTFDTVEDEAEFNAAISRGDQRLLYIVTCYRDVIPPSTDTHSVQPVWSVIRAESTPTPHATDPRRWLIDVESGYRESNSFFYNSSDGSGRFPCERIFVGPEEAFHTITFDNWYFARNHKNHRWDLERKRQIKLQTKTASAIEDLETAGVQYYDRDDPTMNVDGTLVDDWNEGNPPAHNGNLGDNTGSDPFQDPELPEDITKFRDPTDPVNDPVAPKVLVAEAGLYTERT